MRIIMLIAALVLSVSVNAQSPTLYAHFDFYDVKLYGLDNTSALDYRITPDAQHAGTTGDPLWILSIYCVTPWVDTLQSPEGRARFARAALAYVGRNDTPPATISHIGVDVWSDWTCKFTALGSE